MLKAFKQKPNKTQDRLGSKVLGLESGHKPRDTSLKTPDSGLKTQHRSVRGIGVGGLIGVAILYLLSSIHAPAQPSVPPPKTTAFTRGLIGTNTTSAEFRAALGFLSTNNTVITNYTGNGASITNLNADELRSGTVPLARLTGITASQVADATLTTNKVDATFHALLGGGGGSGDVTQSGLAAGSYPINGQPITNLLSVLAQLESGSAKTSRSPGGYATLGAYGTNNTSSSFVIGAGNQGIVKTLFCHLDVGSAGGVQTNINSLDLLIYTDGTATGNLTARIKVADLLNCYYRYPTTNWTIRSHSRFLSFYTDPLSERSGFPLYHFTLNLPMPFTNGISFKLTNSVAGTTWTHGYFQAQYELKSLSPELFSTRAYITNIHGAMSSGTSNFLFSATGASEIVGFQIGLSNSSLSGAAQGLADKGLAFYIDSTVFTYDLDDWLENTYAGVYGEFLAQEVGWPHNDYDATLDGGGAGAQEAYRWLPQDSIRSTNSMVVYFDGNVVMESAYYNFFYYKR